MVESTDLTTTTTTTTTPHSTHYSLHPTPYTLHPNIYTLHPAPHTLGCRLRVRADLGVQGYTWFEGYAQGVKMRVTLRMSPPGSSGRMIESTNITTTTSKPLFTPYTIYHAPYTIHPTPYTLHPTPYTRTSTPYTPHRTPYTLRFALRVQANLGVQGHKGLRVMLRVYG